MPANVSPETVRAIELIRTENMSPWAAARAVGIQDSTLYRSRLYLDFLLETQGPVIFENAMARLRNSPVWGGDDPKVTPQLVAKGLEIPVKLVYLAEEFQSKVVEHLDCGFSLAETSKRFGISTNLIKTLPRYVEAECAERVKLAFEMIDGLTCAKCTPQEAAQRLGLGVNHIYHSEAFQERVMTCVAAGMSLTRISDELGIGPRAIKKLPRYVSYLQNTK